MKKFLKFVVPSLASLVLLAGCGGSADDAVVDKGVMRKRVTIKFTHNTGKAKEAQINQFIKQFKEVEPNITVISDKLGSGDYNVAANDELDRYFGDNHGDIFYTYPDSVCNFIDIGAAYDIQPYVDHPEYGFTAEEKADYIKNFYDEGTNYYMDGTYSLPWSKSTELMYYDARILDESLNLQKPDGTPLIVTEEYMNNITWDQLFEELAPALKTAAVESGLITTSNPKWAVVGHDSSDNLFITLAHQYGYDYTEVKDNVGVNKFDNPEMRALMEKFNGYYKDHLLTTKEILGNDFTNKLRTDDNVLITIGSTAGSDFQYVKENPQDILVCSVPSAPLAEDGSNKDTYSDVIQQGPSVTFLTHKKSDGSVDEDRQLASWLFYKFCMSPNNSWIWAREAKYMPVRRSGYDNDEFKEISSLEGKSPKTLEVLKARVNTQILEELDSFFTSPTFVGSLTSRSAVKELVTLCLADTAKDEALKTNIAGHFAKALNKANAGIAGA